jgi:hypothetical protein
VVIVVDESEAFSNSLQATRFWREILGIGISPSDNWSKSLKRRISEPVLFDDSVETTVWTVVTQFGIRHIERNRPFAPCYLHYLIRWHIEELGLRINEPFD